MVELGRRNQKACGGQGVSGCPAPSPQVVGAGHGARRYGAGVLPLRRSTRGSAGDSAGGSARGFARELPLPRPDVLSIHVPGVRRRGLWNGDADGDAGERLRLVFSFESAVPTAVRVSLSLSLFAFRVVQRGWSLVCLVCLSLSLSLSFSLADCMDGLLSCVPTALSARSELVAAARKARMSGKEEKEEECTAASSADGVVVARSSATGINRIQMMVKAENHQCLATNTATERGTGGLG